MYLSLALVWWRSEERVNVTMGADETQEDLTQTSFPFDISNL
jgi:hypothetical protein